MKSKALSILTSTALVLGPVGTTAIASGSAYADNDAAGNPVYADILNGYPRQARLLIAQYQLSYLSADQLRTMMYQLVSGNMLSEADFERLMLALETGVFDCIPVVNVEEEQTEELVAPEYDELEALIREFEEAREAGLPLPDYTDAVSDDAQAEIEPPRSKETTALIGDPGIAGKGLIPIGTVTAGTEMTGYVDPSAVQAPSYLPGDTTAAAAQDSLYAGVATTPVEGAQTISVDEIGRLPIINKSEKDSGMSLGVDDAAAASDGSEYAVSDGTDLGFDGVTGIPEIGKDASDTVQLPDDGDIVIVDPADQTDTVMPGETTVAVPVQPQVQTQPTTQDKLLVIPNGGTYTPVRYSTNTTVEAFIATIGEQAREIAQENDLYASVMIAQAILESGSGTSGLSQAPNFNLFGIKGDYNGNSVRMMTQEDDGTGTRYSIRAAFRQYSSYQESLEDYADLLKNGLYGFYHGAWKSEAATPAAACDYLQGRYATATDYSANLQNLIATYDLTRFDDPLPYEPVSKIMVQSVSKITGQPLYDETGAPVMEERTLADLTADAVSHLGVPYVWGGTSEISGFDCSGLVQHAYSEALGVQLPRTTYYQWLVGEDVPFSDLHPGDLLFFANGTDVHHVAIYLGDGFYIHAPQTGDVVRVTAMEDYMPTFAKRIIQTKPVGLTASVVLPTIEKQVVRVPNELAGEIDKQLQNIMIYSTEELA